MIKLVTVDEAGTEKEVDPMTQEEADVIMGTDVATDGSETVREDGDGPVAAAPEPLVLTPTEREMPAHEPPTRKRGPKGVEIKTTVTKTVVKEMTLTEADIRRLLRLPANCEIEARTNNLDEVTLVASWTVTV